MWVFVPDNALELLWILLNQRGVHVDQNLDASMGREVLEVIPVQCWEVSPKEERFRYLQRPVVATLLRISMSLIPRNDEGPVLSVSDGDERAVFPLGFGLRHEQLVQAVVSTGAAKQPIPILIEDGGSSVFGWNRDRLDAEAYFGIHGMSTPRSAKRFSTVITTFACAACAGLFTFPGEAVVGVFLDAPSKKECKEKSRVGCLEG